LNFTSPEPQNPTISSVQHHPTASSSKIHPTQQPSMIQTTAQRGSSGKRLTVEKIGYFIERPDLDAKE